MKDLVQLPRHMTSFTNEQSRWTTTYEALLLPLYQPALQSNLDEAKELSDHNWIGFEPESHFLSKQPAWQEAKRLIPANWADTKDYVDKIVRQGRFGEGIAILENLHREQPMNMEITHRLGVVFRGLGEDYQTEKWYRRSLSGSGEPLHASRVELAEFLLVRRRYKEARSLLSSLPEGFRTQFRTLIVEACLYLAEKNEIYFKKILAQLLDAAGRDVEKISHVLRFLAENSRLEDLKDLNRILKHSEFTSWQYELQFIKCLYRTKQSSLALELARSLPSRHPNEGLIWLEVGRIELAMQNIYRAADAYHNACMLLPSAYQAWYGLAVTGFKLRNRYTASNALLECLKKMPYYANAHMALGELALGVGATDLALLAARSAVLLQPNNYLAWSVLSLATHHHGLPHHGEVLAKYSLSINKECDATNITLAIIYLSQGKYEKAWPHYEWRLNGIVEDITHGSLVRWDEKSPPEELILVHEQGIGDLVQFMRYCVVLRTLIPRISIIVQPKLINLILHFGAFDEIYDASDTCNLPRSAPSLPLLSVPRLLNLKEEFVLIDEPYLAADPKLTSIWARRFRPKRSKKFIVGINWQGNPSTEFGEFYGRSFALSEFEPLSSIENIELVSLQKGPGSEQIEECSFRSLFTSAQKEVDATWDLVETLAIISACDLIITSDTSVAHLSGAMGHPTWVLLKHIPDWRWGLKSEMTPWYPSMHLFRQSSTKEWGEVMARVRIMLLNLIRTRPDGRVNYTDS